MSNRLLETPSAPVAGMRGGLAHDNPSLLQLLDRISFVMDRLVAIPGTRWRGGLNTLLMLLPVGGDALASLVSMGILVAGLSNKRVPRIVATRMICNSVLDASIGWIPILGTVFDFFFKADTRNVRLLREYAGQTEAEPHSLWGHYLFVGGILGVFVLFLVLLFVAVTLLMQSLHTQHGA